MDETLSLTATEHVFEGENGLEYKRLWCDEPDLDYNPAWYVRTNVKWHMITTEKRNELERAAEQGELVNVLEVAAEDLRDLLEEVKQDHPGSYRASGTISRIEKLLAKARPEAREHA